MHVRSLLAVIFFLLAHAATTFSENLLTSEVFGNVFYLAYGKSSGSSFTLNVDGRQYLITAKHVVNGIKENDEIRFWNRKELTSVRVKPIYCENPRVDIVALALPQQLPTPRLEATKNFHLTQQVYFVGYPQLITEKGASLLYSKVPLSPNVSGFPFVKAGIISAIDFSIPVLYLDGHNNQGFSGGPIVVYQQESKLFGVLAVISGYHYEELPLITPTPPSQKQAGEVPKEAEKGEEKEKKDKSPFIQANMGIVVGFFVEEIIKAIRKNPIGPKVE